MKKNKMIAGGLAFVLFALSAAGCGNDLNGQASAVPNEEELVSASSSETEAEEEEEPADVLFSCAGGWESDDHTVYILNEDGSGEQIISMARGSGDNEKITPYSKKDCTWEEDSIRMLLSQNNKEKEFYKKIEDGLDVLTLDDTDFYRISGKDMKKYKKLDLPDYSKKLAEEMADESIDLNEKVIVDNEIITVKALKFIWMNDIEPCVSFQMTNNTDREIAFGFLDVYLHDTQVVQTWYGGVMNLQPGKTGTYQLSFYINGPDGREYAGALEDLYGLNGTFSVWLFTEDGRTTEWGKYNDFGFSLDPNLGNETGESGDQA